jgi:hypothetical protein
MLDFQVSVLYKCDSRKIILMVKKVIDQLQI